MHFSRKDINELSHLDTRALEDIGLVRIGINEMSSTYRFVDEPLPSRFSLTAALYKLIRGRALKTVVPSPQHRLTTPLNPT